MDFLLFRHSRFCFPDIAASVALREGQLRGKNQNAWRLITCKDRFNDLLKNALPVSDKIAAAAADEIATAASVLK